MSSKRKSTVRQALEFYKSLGYAGVFVTNHFIDGNINIDRTLPYEDKINFYFSDIEERKVIAKEIGIDIFEGLETSYRGTDFLVYGLKKEWWLAHPEVAEMRRSEFLSFLRESGALVIQAHPYREASYIDHIRLFPRYVHGTEVYNAAQQDFFNSMAEIYAKAYDLIPFAGSDCHNVEKQTRLGGMQFKEKIKDELDFIERIKNGEGEIFKLSLETNTEN